MVSSSNTAHFTEGRSTDFYSSTFSDDNESAGDDDEERHDDPDDVTMCPGDMQSHGCVRNVRIYAQFFDFSDIANLERIPLDQFLEGARIRSSAAN